jgi:dihydrodipicolinate synthase/N-acetylneuraminate lyase
MLMPIARSVGTSFGVPGLKAAMNELGLRGGYPRPPLRPAPPNVIETIRGQLEQLGRVQRLHN